jgi:LPS sulfotransferase NodH
LTGTEVCGRPSEYALGQVEHKWRDLHGCRTRQQYLDFYLRKGLSTNGIFGAKLTWWQFCEFTAELAGSSSLSNQERALLLTQTFHDCRYIFLRRHDQVRQVVSYSRALQTGRWSSKTAGSTNHPAEEIFDVDALDELARAISVSESLWVEYLTELGTHYLPVFYEDLVREPSTWIARILAYLGVDHKGADLCRSELQQQSDDLTEEWVRRYKILRSSP